MRYLYAILLCTLAADAHALSWPVVPAETIEPDVSIEYWLTEGTPTGAELGAPERFIGPLEPGVARGVVADAFVATGRTICLHAVAVFDAQRGPEVHRCDRFPRLDAPTLLAPR